MICYERILHETHVGKSQHWEKRDAVECPCKQHGSADWRFPFPTKDRRDTDRHEERKPITPIGYLNVPLRIDETEVDRHKHLAQVKPNGCCGPQDPLEQSSRRSGAIEDDSIL